MIRSFSFLLFTFGVVVIFLFDRGMTGGTNNRVHRYFEADEIPEYDLLFWPSPKGKSNQIKNLAVFGKSRSHFIAPVVKRNEHNDTYIINRANTQRRNGFKTNKEVVVPILVEPTSEHTSPSLEIIAIPETDKPKPGTQKPIEKTTIKPLATTAKPTTAKSSSTTKRLQKVTQSPNKVSGVTTVKPTAIRLTTTKPNIPTRKGQIAVRNSTTAVVNQVTVQPVKVTVKPLETTTKPVKQKPPTSPGPCTCIVGVCTCCSGPLLGLLSQKACLKVIYIPEDFAFDYSLMLNNRVLYQNKVSGKNPRPACISIPGLNRIKLCAKFSNIYFAGRNIHFCMGIEGKWDYDELFNMPFDCVRMGAQGFGIVKPEDGGFLAPGGLDSVIDAGGDDIGEYDENVVRNLFYY